MREGLLFEISCFSLILGRVGHIGHFLSKRYKETDDLTKSVFLRPYISSTHLLVPIYLPLDYLRNRGSQP